MKFFLLSLLLAWSGCYTIKRVSEASTDGPYVLYRNDKVIIKSITKVTGEPIAKSDTIVNKNQVNLTCYVDESTESFSIPLRDSLKIPPAEYPLPERLLAISDIEGNYKAFKTMLLGAGVIYENNSWAFKNGHLVLVGDFFDRGTSVTETLWLIYKLEQEAEKAGGRVHFILGNHEMMNLYGNAKYVDDKYFKNAMLLKEKYSDLYSPDTELGRWLRTKNIAERIGNTLFIHAGISPKIVESELSLAQLNTIARAHIGTPLKEISQKEAQLVYDTQEGPFWYRGIAKGGLPQEKVDEILRYAQCEKMVIGHTIMENITPLYQNKIIAIDLHHSDNFDDGFMKALWIENGNFFVIDDKGKRQQLF